jgi:hypothetical protein
MRQQHRLRLAPRLLLRRAADRLFLGEPRRVLLRSTGGRGVGDGVGVVVVEGGVCCAVSCVCAAAALRCACCEPHGSSRRVGKHVSPKGAHASRSQRWVKPPNEMSSSARHTKRPSGPFVAIVLNSVLRKLAYSFAAIFSVHL